MLYDILLKIAAAAFMLFFFGFCIFIHELGHFLTAKWRGLHIAAFSIGYRKVWWKRINGVEYRLGCIPVGGYVDLPQIDASGDAKDGDGNLLPKVKPLDRMLVAFSGPLFNVLFGLLLGVAVWIHGLPRDSASFKEIKVESVQENSPEWNAGLRQGDVIYELNGQKFDTTWNGFVNKIFFTIGDVTLSVRRAGKELHFTYQPAVNKEVAPEEEIAYPFFRPEMPVYLFPDRGSAAERSGVRAGDLVLAVNGKKVRGMDELAAALLYAQDRPLDLTLLRGKDKIEIRGIVPVPEKGGGKTGTWLLGFAGNPVENVADGHPMHRAGLRPGDLIVEVAGKQVETVKDIQDVVRTLNGKTALVRVKRGDKFLTLHAAPEFVKFTTIGVTFAPTIDPFVHPNPFEQFKNVMVLTWNSLRGIGYSLGNRLHLTRRYTTIKPKHMSGPIGIGKYLFLSVYRGSLIRGLYMVIIITFNLGLINLLPVPVLDGGHILLGLLELVFSRPVPRKVLEPVSVVFITLLIAFMIFVSFHDVRKLVSPVLRSWQSHSPPSVVPAAEKTAHDTPTSNK